MGSTIGSKDLKGKWDHGISSSKRPAQGPGLADYMKNDPTLVQKVMKLMSWRGLGEVLGALGAPLGPQGGPKSGF